MWVAALPIWPSQRRAGFPASAPLLRAGCLRVQIDDKLSCVDQVGRACFIVFAVRLGCHSSVGTVNMQASVPVAGIAWELGEMVALPARPRRPDMQVAGLRIADAVPLMLSCKVHQCNMQD